MKPISWVTEIPERIEHEIETHNHRCLSLIGIKGNVTETVNAAANLATKTRRQSEQTAICSPLPPVSSCPI
jgi:hypothetical protein